MGITSLKQYYENLERLIKNNDFDEFINYYYITSNDILNDEDLDKEDIYKLVIECFKYCAMYNNIKIFKYLYTIFNEEDLSDYKAYVDNSTIRTIFKNLIINKQYEMFHYLESILLDATKIFFNSHLRFYLEYIIDYSMDANNYEIFEYVIVNYKNEIEDTTYELLYDRIYYSDIHIHRDLTNDEKRRFYQILLIHVPFTVYRNDYKGYMEITHDMIQCGAFEFGTFDEYIDNYLYGINTLIKTYKHKKNYVMDKIFFKNK